MRRATQSVKSIRTSEPGQGLLALSRTVTVNAPTGSAAPERPRPTSAMHPGLDEVPFPSTHCAVAAAGSASARARATVAKSIRFMAVPPPAAAGGSEALPIPALHLPPGHEPR